MKASCDERVQAQERVGGEAAGEFVVVGGAVEGVPLLNDKKLGPDLQGFVGACHKEGGGMFSPGGGGIFSSKGKRGRPSLSGMVRWPSAWTGRCLCMGGEGTGVRQSKGR